MVDPDELASSAHVIHVLKIILTGGAWPGGRSKIKEGTTTARSIVVVGIWGWRFLFVL